MAMSLIYVPDDARFIRARASVLSAGQRVTHQIYSDKVDQGITRLGSFAVEERVTAFGSGRKAKVKKD